MAVFREFLVRGGRAYVDSGDVAAVIVRGDDFFSLAPPEQPIRFLLSGCGDTADVYGVSVQSLFEARPDAPKTWLDPAKYTRLTTQSGKLRGHVFLNARHVVGLIMGAGDDNVTSTQKSPLHVLIRGASKQITGWGLSPLDFMVWLQSAGREVRLEYLERAA